MHEYAIIVQALYFVIWSNLNTIHWIAYYFDLLADGVAAEGLHIRKN